MKNIIEVNNLSKKYELKEYVPYYSLRDSIIQFFKRKSLNSNEFWALKDISFTVKEGEFVGIIGSNGAGKSTLLKILSKVTYPTEGKVVLRGRMASLLEVGTGFHPELTGRENILLYGTILGMNKKEISNHFNDIVEFAEVSNFIDTPVKHYSSGMYTRLAFSVAVHMKPEILIIDEVLAVGDAAFQKKCINKMEELSNSGCTILFVSHNMSLVSNLCQRSILLDRGRVVDIGKTENIISKYLKNSNQNIIPLNNRKDRTGNGVIKLKYLKITNNNNETVIKSFDKIRVSLGIKQIEKFSKIEIKIAFVDPSSRTLFRIDSDTIANNHIKNNEIVFETDNINLAPTLCVVNIGLFADGILSDYIKNVYSFEIIGSANKSTKLYTNDIATILLEHKLI